MLSTGLSSNVTSTQRSDIVRPLEDTELNHEPTGRPAPGEARKTEQSQDACQPTWLHMQEPPGEICLLCSGFRFKNCLPV